MDGRVDPSESRVLAFRSYRTLTSWAGIWPKIGAVAVLLLMVHTVAETVARSFPAFSVPGAIEYVEYWYMPAIVFFGLVGVQHRGEHIEAPIMVDRLKHSTRRYVQLFTNLLMIVVLGLFIWFGLDEALTQLDRGERGPVSGIPIWPAKFALLIGCAALALQLLLDSVRSLVTSEER